MRGYDWITNEMFDARLEQMIDETVTAGNLLTIPGVYEVLSEHFNNDVIDALVAERKDEDTEETVDE